MTRYEIIEKIAKEIKTSSYSPDDFELYRSEAGWQYWMNSYTTVKEDEECSSEELRKISKIQAEAFTKAFPNENFSINEETGGSKVTVSWLGSKED